MDSPSFNRSTFSTSGIREHLGQVADSVLAQAIMELAAPALGTAAELKAATPTTVAAQVWTTFVAGGNTKLALHGARAVTFTTGTGTPADAPATVTILGKDIDGAVLTEGLALAQTNTIVTSANCYSSITSCTFAAGDGTGTTVSMGISQTFGLPAKIKSRSGQLIWMQELVNGARPATAATLVSPTTSPPYGNYTPYTNPGGSADYHLIYERDVTGA